MLILGSHVSFGKNQLLGCVETAINNDANAFMFYTGAPQNTIRKTLDKDLIDKALLLMKENDISIDNVICHAPYIVNPASSFDTPLHKFTVDFLRSELIRCSELGIKNLVLHPGSSVKLSKEEGLNNIINTLNEIGLENYSTNICLETMAGKGTECGINLQELKTIYDGIKEKDKITFCLDTCHLNDSGININNFDAYLDDFDKNIGINKIKCIHLNDSKNDIGDHKDRHANIGFGTIGFDALVSVVNNKRTSHIPKILETPFVFDKCPYKAEIAMIKSGTFNSNLLEEL